MLRRRTSQWLLAALIVALGAILAVHGPGIWQLATAKTTYVSEYSGAELRQIVRIQRKTRSGTLLWSKTYYVDSGFLWVSNELLEPNNWTHTVYRRGGKVGSQAVKVGGRTIDWSSRPPWRWGVEDQRKPTAPWVLRGISFPTWWPGVRSPESPL
jgi:hypothetical protein